MRNSLGTFFEMIKFEHTIFALPFAYTGALLGGAGRLSISKFLWITLAMVSARTAAMCLNRIVDKDSDKENPRTANRAIPRGLIHVNAAWIAVLVSLALFATASSALNPLVLYLSPLAIVILWGYSYLKRFTWLCHLGLGLVLACAPIGGYLAVTGVFTQVPILLGTAMIFWLAGFDILYACQDVEFDAEFGIHSIPQRFGISKALWISAFFHVITFFFLAWTGLAAGLGWPYGLGLLAVAALLIYEHAIVTPHDLRRINQAFFQANAAISIIMLMSTAASLWIRG